VGPKSQIISQQDDGSPSQVGLSVPYLTETQNRSTEWRRKKRKKDAEFPERTKEKDAERKREYRKKVKEDTSRAGRFQHKHLKEIQAERQKRYRARKRVQDFCRGVDDSRGCKCQLEEEGSPRSLPEIPSEQKNLAEQTEEAGCKGEG